MFLTALLLVGSGATWWLARIFYNSDSKPPRNIAPRDIPFYRPSWWHRWRGSLAVLVVGGTVTLYFCGAVWFSNYHNEHWVTCRIDSVENLGDDKYRVQSSGTDCGTFDNTNMPWRMKFNAPTLQGWLKKGTTVEMRVVGANSPDWGWYPRVVTVKNIK